MTVGKFPLIVFPAHFLNTEVTIASCILARCPQTVMQLKVNTVQ